MPEPRPLGLQLEEVEVDGVGTVIQALLWPWISRDLVPLHQVVKAKFVPKNLGSLLDLWWLGLDGFINQLITGGSLVEILTLSHCEI
jgi:hypothetical protein